MTYPKKKAVMNWSGGKDSALALYKTLTDNQYEVISLLTTVNKSKDSSSMHEIPLSLLQKQADCIGIPLYMVDLDSSTQTNTYAKAMTEAVSYFKEQGVKHFIFGDIFLFDVKSYREERLNPLGIEVVEPLWGKTSEEVMSDFIKSELQTVITTTMADKLGEEFIGQIIKPELIAKFPKEIDVCGENGEYHSFCYSGKLFKHAVPFTLDTPRKVSHTFTMDDQSQKSFDYWHATLHG